MIWMDYVIAGAVKLYLKKNGMRVAKGTYEALDQEVERLLKRACERTKMNGRQTVMPQDL